MNPVVKLAAIAKNEAAYIPQWIYHHIFFGFSEIEIWLNDTTDNSIGILEKIIEINKEKISYKIADDFLASCKKNNKNFQIEAYTEIYNKTKTSNCSHIMFLDLDEFWTPKNLKTSIADFIVKSPDFDAASFEWLIDTPDINRAEFQSPFQIENTLQKNRHVKTLLKITNKVRKIKIHNHIIEDGLYILADGSPFLEIDKDQYDRAKIPSTLHNSTREKTEEYFIYHQINRSRVEYLSSLLRGNRQVNVNDDNILKANRIGYIEGSHTVKLTLEENALNHYKTSTKEKYSPEIENELKKSQEFVKERFLEATDLLRKNPKLIKKYRSQLRGLKINDLIIDKIKEGALIYCIDGVRILEKNSGIVITGWAFDFLSSQKPVIEISIPCGSETRISLSNVNRPDVLKVHPDAHLDCGFRIEIFTPEKLPPQVGPAQHLEIYLRSPTSTERIKIPLPHGLWVV